MKSIENSFLKGLFIMLAVFAVLFAGALALLDYMNDASESVQLEMVENAVRDAVVTCYAVEGAYPEDLQYLVDNYGLYYDEERFVVFYDAFASNIIPEIRVRMKGGLAHE